MLHTFYRTIIPMFLVALPMNAALAASFALPSDAAINVERFTFPESAEHASEQNLSTMLHDHLAQTLQQAGFSVDSSLSAPQAKEGAGADENTPTTVTPISENGGEKAHVGGTAPAESTGAESAGTGITEVTELTENRETEQAKKASGKKAGQDLIQSVFATQVVPASSVYKIAGRVTLLRENIGAPTRIGGGIGIRAESILHCAYRVEDASGNVLISSTASGSAARLISNTQNIDTVIANLNEKVVLSVAEKIASGLSGMNIGSSAPASSPDKSYYEDSPGKRLKQNR